MEEPNLLAGSESLTLLTAVESIMKRSCIIDFGIVQKVRASGVVDVAVAVADTPQNMFVMTCVLANIASASLTIDLKPNEGDRVLVVYPRMYDEDMFDIPAGKEKTPIVNEYANGYNLMCGIAILINQYRKNKHKNVIKVDDGAITVESAKTKIEIDKDGNVSIDTEGKYTIKNDSTDLLSVIEGLATEVKNLKTEGSQTAQHTSEASKALIETWEETKLKMLLSDGSSELDD